MMRGRRQMKHRDVGRAVAPTLARIADGVDAAFSQATLHRLGKPADRHGTEQLGAALNASFGRPVASGAQAGRASCASSAVTLEIPAGAAVDAVELREDLTAGQAIAAYTLELQQGGAWVPTKKEQKERTEKRTMC